MSREEPGVGAPERAVEHDTPGVIMFPPLIFLSGLLAGGILSLLDPRSLAAPPALRWLGAVLVGAGLVLAVTGRRALEHAGTSANPMRPASRLVVKGPYRLSRNPMYLAMTIAYTGLALLLDSLWVGVMLAPLLLVLHSGVIAREERYLESKFGDEYRRYRALARRWF